MVDLDDPSLYERLDPSGLRHRLRGFPTQCRLAWQQGLAFPLPPSYRGVNRVLLVGMGGSAIGGDLLRGVVLAQGRIPLEVHRDYTLPAYVDAHTLVIASSYSGETEEVLSAFSLAQGAGAPILALTSGGALKQKAERAGLPILPIPDLGEPRTALPHSFLSLLALFQTLGFLSPSPSSLEDVATTLDQESAPLLPEVPLAQNLAKGLAQRLHGRLAVIYSGGYLAEVGRRWKTQLNENSKAWAFHEVFPELNHNAVVGYRFPPELAERVLVLLLSAPDLHPRLRLRYQITAQLLEEQGITAETVEAGGRDMLSRMLVQILLGDYVSYYLALLNGVDPSPVTVIDTLKERLAQG